MKKYPLLTLLFFSMVQGAWATRDNALLVPFYLRYANAPNEVFFLKAPTYDDIKEVLEEATKKVCEGIVSLHKKKDDHALYAVAVISSAPGEEGSHLHNILNENDLWNPAILQIEDPEKGPTKESKIALRNDLLAKIDNHQIAIPDSASCYTEQYVENYAYDLPKLGNDDIEEGIEQVFNKSDEERSFEAFIQPLLQSQEQKSNEDLKTDIQRLQNELKNATKRGKIMMIIGIMALVASFVVLGVYKLYGQDNSNDSEALPQ